MFDRILQRNPNDVGARLMGAVIVHSRQDIAEARKRYEEEAAKAGKSPLKQPPELGSPEDFPLMQALNQLKNKPVQVSKTATERKPEDATTSQ